MFKNTFIFCVHIELCKMMYRSVLMCFSNFYHVLLCMDVPKLAIADSLSTFVDEHPIAQFSYRRIYRRICWDSTMAL